MQQQNQDQAQRRRSKQKRQHAKKCASAQNAQQQSHKTKKRPPRRPQRTPKIEKHAQTACQQLEEKSTLILISRRPPAQKYANFEEYFKAHTLQPQEQNHE